MTSDDKTSYGSSDRILSNVLPNAVGAMVTFERARYCSKIILIQLQVMEQRQLKKAMSHLWLT